MKMVKSLLLVSTETGGICPIEPIVEGNGGISPGPGTGGDRIAVFGIDGAGFG